MTNRYDPETLTQATEVHNIISKEIVLHPAMIEIARFSDAMKTPKH